MTGQKIVLVSNPDYFEGRPYIDGYIMRIIPDTATMFLELRANGIDRMGLTPLQYTRQTENNLFRKNYNKFRYLSFAYTYLGYNLKNPLFADKRVRQAIAYAVNREEIIDGVLLGLGKPATGPYKPGTWAYNPNVRAYPYDPQKAKALLAEAGWRDADGDGILDKEGKAFEFEIITNQGNEIRAKCAEIIQQRLAEVGIRVKIRVVEWAAFVNDFINKRKFDATILGWTIPMEPDLYDVWHSSKTGPEELNFVSYKNAEVDALIVKARETFDQKLRKRCYDRIQEILAEEQPYLFLYVPDALPIIHARFRGVETAPLGIGWNLHQVVRPGGGAEARHDALSNLTLAPPAAGRGDGGETGIVSRGSPAPRTVCFRLKRRCVWWRFFPGTNSVRLHRISVWWKRSSEGLQNASRSGRAQRSTLFLPPTATTTRRSGIARWTSRSLSKREKAWSSGIRG